MQNADRKGSRVSGAARDLIDMSLKHDAGAFLGGEDYLVSKLGISRLTLRQAAKIAEHERLIEVKRGNKGGFYAARPSASDAVQSLAQYLHLEGTNLSHVQRILRLVMVEAAGLAAESDNAELRVHLKKLASAISKDKTRADVIRRDVELSQTIATMSANPLLKVITAIGNTFGLERRHSLFLDDQQGAEMSRLQYNVCVAILSAVGGKVSNVFYTKLINNGAW